MALISKKIIKLLKINLYILKNNILPKNNILLIFFLYSILLTPQFSKLVKRQHFTILGSEIILKLLRKGYRTIITNHIDQVTSIYLNDVQITKNNKINTNKYRNIVRMVISTNINNCYAMFQNCYEIVEIDLSHFDASHVTDMGNMFSGCSSLTSINFNGFDTSSVTFSMHWMFSNCHKLYSLDLSGFNTVKVECMENMFENCYSLTSLNLKNLKTDGLKFTSDSMFANCYKLEYINLYNAFTNNGYYTSDMFSVIPKNTVFCINNNAYSGFKSLINFGCSNVVCNADWRKNQRKIIVPNEYCINSCELQNNNKYDILNKCYDS